MAAAKRGGGKGSSINTLGLLVLGTVALAALPMTVFCAAAMLPTLVTFLIDRDRPRHLMRTVGAANAAGVFPFLLMMWSGGISLATMQKTLASPFTWLVVYGAAAAGWAIFLSLPPVAQIIVDLEVKQRQKQIETRAAELIEEWGTEVAGADPEE
jgi:hypothetical protein